MALNKSLDFDVRICHPELFSTCATYLDGVVRETLVRETDVEEASFRLQINRGGCGITSAVHKAHFGHLASACQVLPAVGKHLCAMGWSRRAIESAIDFTGIDQCLRLLEQKNIFVSSDGGTDSSRFACPMDGKTILWG